MFVHLCQRTNIKLARCHNSWHCYIKILLRKYINTLIMYIVFSWWCDCNKEPRNGFTPHCFKLWENTISFCCSQLCWTTLLCWNCVYILRGKHPVFFLCSSFFLFATVDEKVSYAAIYQGFGWKKSLNTFW